MIAPVALLAQISELLKRPPTWRGDGGAVGSLGDVEGGRGNVVSEKAG
jgi:hypothetical protein